ncbi:FadR family transcriptional regulator [Corynebacterium diphtheriae]|nr:FadR family transcriptional regulator [Corynebacterium diphtheriae]
MKDHSGISFGKNPTVLAIENYIRENGLTPGDVLPSEAAICEHLSVSRSSVREAMRTLASLDVVEIRHGHGTYVGKMSMAPLVNGMVLRLTLNENPRSKTSNM